MLHTVFPQHTPLSSTPLWEIPVYLAADPAVRYGTPREWQVAFGRIA